MEPSRRVLLVADEVWMRITVGLALQEHGYEVCVVGNGTTPAQAVADCSPHIILVDVGGNKTRLKALRFIEQCVGLSDPPVALIVLSDEDTPLPEILPGNVRQILHKPFTLKQLFQSVADHLSS